MTTIPKLMTAKELAEQLGFSSVSTVRSLRERGLIMYTEFLGRYMYPREAIDQFIQNNTVMPCPDKNKVQDLFLTAKEEVTITSVGQKTDATAKKARLRAITKKLK